VSKDYKIATVKNKIMSNPNDEKLTISL